MAFKKGKSKKPLVCICLINWNGGKMILNCLGSLFEKTSYKNYKVVVIDNGSTDNSAEMIPKRFTGVDLVLLKENLGYPGGMNTAFRYCLDKYNPPYIVTMNSDIVTIQPKWLDIMIRVMERDEKIGLCGHKLTYPNGDLQILFEERGTGWIKEENRKDRGQYDFIKEVRGTGLANCVIRADAIRKTGGLDEQLFFGADDSDYCRRLRGAGFKIVYNGFSKSVHIGSFAYRSAIENDKIYFQLAYGRLLWHFRHDGFRIVPLAFLRQLIRAFVTRSYVYKEPAINNMYFHKRFLIRLSLLPKAFFKALKDYKGVEHPHFDCKLKNADLVANEGRQEKNTRRK